MTIREITIINSLGIHARPAAEIVKLAALSRAELWIEKDGQKINGKSIMGVMMLACEQWSRVKFYADGEGEKALLDEIEKLIKNKFNEE